MRTIRRDNDLHTMIDMGHLDVAAELGDILVRVPISFASKHAVVHMNFDLCFMICGDKSSVLLSVGDYRK